MSACLHKPTVGPQVDVSVFGSRMEAATEALLRVRNEVISTIDHQVMELQMIHRAFAVAPASTIIVEEDAPIESSSRSLWEGPSLFENPPKMPGEPGVRPNSPLSSTLPMKRPAVEAADSIAEDPGALATETALDPVLEQATLEELNDALASAFALVSSRNHR